ncbi:MAG: OmpA family protein [Burkholderiales bacterium]|nr:OmpA family protein [Burkholderiales bacterium]
MTDHLRYATTLLCATLAAASLALPVEAIGICAAPPAPESRSAVFDGGLFERGQARLSAGGRAQLAALAQALDAAALEVVVVSVPAHTPGPRALARQRAEVVRWQLAQHGLPRERIYVEQRGMHGAVAQPVPVLVEAIALWPRQLATHHGWRCVAQAPLDRGL